MRRRLPPLLLTVLPVALIATGVLAWEAIGTRAQATQPPRALALIVIDRETEARLGPLVPQYQRDATASLKRQYGPDVSVGIQSVDLASYFPEGAPDEPGHNRLTIDLARTFAAKRATDGLVGIVLIGNIPLPRVYEDGAHLSIWPWIDLEDPAYVEDAAMHRMTRNPRAKDPRAELWSGVIRDAPDPLPAVTLQGPLSGTPPGGKIETFLAKNHLAHTNALSYEPRFLLVDTWGEEQMQDIQVNGNTPPPSMMPGGAEVARRQTAERFAQRLISTGVYDGMNFADDFLPKQLPKDAGKTLRELYDAQVKDEGWTKLREWREGDGKPRKQIDVASQVILYFDLWTSENDTKKRLDAARDVINASVSAKRPGFDLFSRGDYSFCTDSAPSSGNGYWSLADSEKDALAPMSGFGDRQQLEFVLKWSKIYTPGEKRLSLLRDGVPPFGKYRGVRPTYDVRLIIAPGDTAYTVRGASMDGQCFSRGPNAATRGGKLEILLGAATAAETSRVPSSNLALWDVLSGLPQATVGLLAGPPADLNLPSDLSTLSREEILALGEKATMPGFGRAASVTGTAEGTGFENDPFLLAILAGQPFGEAMRPGWDEPQILYGDPTFHL